MITELQEYYICYRYFASLFARNNYLFWQNYYFMPADINVLLYVLFHFYYFIPVELDKR